MASTTAYKPPHYCSEISLRNFRGFRDTRPLRLAPLTFLVGPNSSGKSSLSDALMLIAQSNFGPRYLAAQIPNWGGPLVDLGSYADAVYQHRASRRISIALAFDAEFLYEPWARRRRKVSPNPPLVRVTFTLSGGADVLGRLRTITFDDLQSGTHAELVFRTEDVAFRFAGRESTWKPETATFRSEYAGMEWLRRQLGRKPPASKKYGSPASIARLARFISSHSMSWFLGQSQRVTSGRAAPRRWYPVASSAFQPFQRRQLQDVFESVDPATVAETKRHPQTEKERVTLASVLRDLEIATAIHDKRLSAYHSAIYVSDPVTRVTSNLMDVGYGASQVIPVIQACLSGAVGPLVIEQPELHLHPRAQGRLADLLCDASRRRQVIVETHSVHFINHARILVARGELPPEHVVVQYISRTRAGSRVHTIPIGSDGDFLAEWPEGFFDERYHDTMRLLEIQSERTRE